MIRYKILGAKNFASNQALHEFEENADSGSFTIGKLKNYKLKFEEITPPPKRVWVRYNANYMTCSPIAVIKNSNSNAVWQPPSDICTSLEITPLKILYTKESALVDGNWQLNANVSLINFQQTQTIYLNDEVAFHLWPCGARADINFDPHLIEQLYVEPDANLDLKNMHITPLRNWKNQNLQPGQAGRHLNQSVIFYPPHPKITSAAQFINKGNINCILSQGSDLAFTYQSCGFENPSKTSQTLDILFERSNT
jgi:hypothetical protein